MLKFITLINFGLAGALIVPALTQDPGSIEQLETSIAQTDAALGKLEGLEAKLVTGEYPAVEEILQATEAPFGDERERSVLLDRLRTEIGQLEAEVERFNGPPPLAHLLEDPTQPIRDEAAIDSATPTVGLSQENRDTLEDIWPPVPGAGATAERRGEKRIVFEKEGFTVDALRQGRAYYRAGRYKEALRLIETRRGEPEADYWIGRCLERLDRTKEAIAVYASVEAAVESGPLADRARADREFLEWLVDFDNKVRDLRGDTEESKR